MLALFYIYSFEILFKYKAFLNKKGFFKISFNRNVLHKTLDSIVYKKGCFQYIIGIKVT